jgi:hypothetical protein
MRRGGDNRQVAEIQMHGRKVRNVAEADASGATFVFPQGDRRMKLSNRKPLYLALALTLAAPLAFAQSTTPQSATQDATNAATSATQDATNAATSATQDTTNAATSAAQDTTNAATQDATAATQNATQDATKSAMPQTGKAQKVNWSDLDTDKNGTLSASESASVQSLSAAFAKADANADGELTQDEYKAYLAANGKGEAKSDSGG